MSKTFLVHCQDGQHRYMTYKQYLASPEWRQRAQGFKKRAGFRCQWCKSQKMLTIHHLRYDTLGREKPRDIEVLCWNCHEPLREAHL